MFNIHFIVDGVFSILFSLFWLFKTKHSYQKISLSNTKKNRRKKCTGWHFISWQYFCDEGGTLTEYKLYQIIKCHIQQISIEEMNESLINSMKMRKAWEKRCRISQKICDSDILYSDSEYPLRSHNKNKCGFEARTCDATVMSHFFFSSLTQKWAKSMLNRSISMAPR